MKKLITILILTIAVSCSQDHSQSVYKRWVGDSEFTAEMDAEEFEICNSEALVKQYFHFDQGLQYKGEKKKLTALFMDTYKPVEIKQSGLIRIRFIVNCKGNTGRFRMIGADQNYQEQAFDERITSQLLKITQSLDGWIIHTKRNKARDYYQYLIFKIVNGKLIEIMP